MDSNKDEALRCVGIAKAALASGNKEKALRLIKIARRLDGNLVVDDILSACEGVDSTPLASPSEDRCSDGGSCDSGLRKGGPRPLNGDRCYTDENVELIRGIKRNKDYYAILGVEKGCSVEEIRKAYRKLSLKIHPDKNRASGAEEAFKTVSKAFRCLSEEESRRHYDQVGLVEEFECNSQYNNARTRRQTRHNSVFDEDFDPDEIFRSFFFGSRREVFRNAHVYRAGRMGTGHQQGEYAGQQRENSGGGWLNIMPILQILPILFIFLLAYLPYPEPNYSLQKTYAYMIPKVTEKYGVEYYVKSSDFDQQFPPGSISRTNIEFQIASEYRNFLARYCRMEMQRRQWARTYPAPHCEKLQNFGAA